MTFEYQKKGHKYFMDGKAMTGVTTVLGVLAKPALIGWAARMATDYISNEWHPGRAYTEEEIIPILEAAKSAHVRIKEDAGEKGTSLHLLVSEYILACIEKNNGVPLEVCLKTHSEEESQREQKNGVKT